jgi:3-polyprenyl-4-hydroxybenzoate decarboxylase
MAEQPDRTRDAISTVPANTSDPGARSNLEPRLPYDDLRQWLEQARKLGEVKDVSGLSWQEDIGIVAGVVMHDDGAPCFVFDAVPGTIKGSRVLVNFFGGMRKNMTLGFPSELSKLELSEGFPHQFFGDNAADCAEIRQRRTDFRECHDW